MSSTIFVTTLMVLASVVSANEVARLLVRKSLINNYIVEQKDLTISYEVYNIGSAAASDVTLTDTSYHPDVFTLKQGNFEAKWTQIGPNSNVTHLIVLEPKIATYYNFSSATIKYRNSELAEDLQVGYSSEYFNVEIIPRKAYDRKFSSHFVDWCIFIVLASLSVVSPYWLYHKSTQSYHPDVQLVHKKKA